MPRERRCLLHSGDCCFRRWRDVEATATLALSACEDSACEEKTLQISLPHPPGHPGQPKLAGTSIFPKEFPESLTQGNSLHGRYHRLSFRIRTFRITLKLHWAGGWLRRVWDWEAPGAAQI